MADQIRRIDAKDVSNAVRDLFLKANSVIGDDVAKRLDSAIATERDPLARGVLSAIRENDRIACEKGLPICQDTGMAVVFAEIGSLLHIEGDTLENAVNRGVSEAYLDGKLRCSVVRDPLFYRENTGDNTPAILHVRTVPGDRLKLTAAPKGFGSENMSALKMFTPSAKPADIVDFVVGAVAKAGSNPCPPVTVGVGIGSDFEGCALLAKKALTRSLSDSHPDPNYREMEKTILDGINALGIGPQGFGGDTSAFAVKIEVGPTHIAGLPVAVNVNCHVVRHAEIVL
ncbi:MAG: fumarate hydratase [Clostridia bacterium]|nr:fumarate hydratase [Clostridia bacterium]